MDLPRIKHRRRWKIIATTIVALSFILIVYLIYKEIGPKFNISLNHNRINSLIKEDSAESKAGRNRIKMTVEMNYPELPVRLEEQWKNIIPSDGAASGARPCRVTLVDGSVYDRVYVVSAQEYIEMWGVWPHEDRGKKEIDVSRVAKISESPDRIPPYFSDKMYKVGESGMGYYLFTVVFKDQSKKAYLTGDAVDFIPLPGGKSMQDIVDVLPNVGRERQDRIEGLDYYWCLFGHGKNPIKFVDHLE